MLSKTIYSKAVLIDVFDIDEKIKETKLI